MSNVVGRDEEVASLESFLAGDRSRRVVLAITGEAGIGKSTVWEEAVRLAERRGDAVKGATVSVKGKTASTNSVGIATLVFAPGVTGKATATVTSPGYQTLTDTVTL